MHTEVAAYPPVDFLAVGHVCNDLVPGGYVIGGAASYSSAVARALGCRSGIVTSAAWDADWSEELAGIAVHNAGAAATTLFENIYTPSGRIQTIHAVGGDITANHIPPLWTRAPIVFLGPIANEVDPAIINILSNSLVGVGPQGWMRRWDKDGRIFQVEWEAAAEVLPMAAATFLSTEDVPDQTLLESYARLARILVVTDGANGCKVYCHNEERSFQAPGVQMVDTTGAGDIFASAYLIRLLQTDGDVWEAADFANHIAACSVTRHGLSAKLSAIRRLLDEDYRRPAGAISEV